MQDDDYGNSLVWFQDILSQELSNEGKVEINPTTSQPAKWEDWQTEDWYLAPPSRNIGWVTTDCTSLSPRSRSPWTDLQTKQGIPVSS